MFKIYSFLLLFVLCFSNCASSKKATVSKDFKEKVYKEIENFKKKHTMKTKIDKKFEKGLNDQKRMDEKIDHIYFISDKMGIDKDCIATNFEKGIEQVYQCHDKLLNYLVKKYPKILEEQYKLNYSTNTFWNYDKKICKEVSVAECSVDYKGEKYFLNKKGKIYLQKNLLEK